MNKDQLFIKKVTEAKNRNLWGLPFEELIWGG